MPKSDDKAKDQLISFGAHLLPRDPLADWESQERRNREMLSHALNLKDTIVFVGAGCSIPLNYPSWQELAEQQAIPLARAVIEQHANPKRELKERSLSILAKLEARLVGPSLPKTRSGSKAVSGRDIRTSSSDRAYVLGACERICRECGCAWQFRSSLATLFRRSPKRYRWNPHWELQQLPVHRFVTSNYDIELERAIVSGRGLRPQDYFYNEPDFGKKSFTQLQEYDEQLAVFSIAFADYEPRVFHCHGWHFQPQSMVLTEDDYQEWYLRDQAITGRYRQSIDLTFNSNPILFAGFSLTDDDLLVPLRFLSAVDREGKASRPLFALLADPTSSNANRYEQLFDRYGIHVLTYPAATPESARIGKQDLRLAEGESLCMAIRRIAADGRNHRGNWLQKPKFRRDPVSRSEASFKNFLHFEYSRNNDPMLAPERGGDAKVSEILHVLRKSRDSKTIWLVGPDGTGKSWMAMRLLYGLDSKAGFSGSFFWSFRYSHDALSGFEHAVRFMGQEPRGAEELLDQFLALLQTKRYLIVLDGFDRLLHQNCLFPGRSSPADPPLQRAQDRERVSAVNSAYADFLRKLTDPEFRNAMHSVLVITSRILPSVVEQANRGKTLEVDRVTGFNLDQVCTLLPKTFSGEKAKQTGRLLLSWFNRHRYGTTLAANWLASHEVDELLYEMAETDPEHRVARMISLALTAAGEQRSPASKAAIQLLTQLAVFIEPVSNEIVKACVDMNVKKLYNDALLLLQSNHLIFEVTYYDRGETRYIVHPAVREYIFHHFHCSLAVELPSFALSGFTSSLEAVYPGERGGPGTKAVLHLFQELAAAPAAQNRSLEICRASFGVIRSRMGATTISRWSRYDQYLQLLVQAIDLVRRNSSPSTRWMYAAIEDGKAGLYLEPGMPLYADELAWLYNEAGLAYYGEGSMLDAIAVWEQAYEINKAIDRGEDGHYVFQSLCNLGACHIHFGKLHTAEVYLEKALKMGRRLEEADHVARIEGYLALLSHLRGNIGEANKRYRAVTRALNDMGNMRAYCIFLRHHADLLLKREATRGLAWEKIQTSKAVAEASSYHDQVAYARLSYGHLYRLEKKFVEAIREYRMALDLSRTMGIRRLEAEAQSELARVDLELGDAQVARRRAMKALQIANEHLLGLRQTHGLVILGKATVHAGERELGMHYLRHAKRLAERQEYRLRANEAESFLYELGVPLQDAGVEPSNTPWPGVSSRVR